MIYFKSKQLGPPPLHLFFKFSLLFPWGGVVNHVYLLDWLAFQEAVSILKNFIAITNNTKNNTIQSIDTFRIKERINATSIICRNFRETVTTALLNLKPNNPQAYSCLLLPLVFLVNVLTTLTPLLMSRGFLSFQLHELHVVCAERSWTEHFSIHICFK